MYASLYWEYKKISKRIPYIVHIRNLTNIILILLFHYHYDAPFYVLTLLATYKKYSI